MKDACLSAKPTPPHLALRILSSNFLLFILVVAGFSLWRHGYPMVWDDTSIYKIAVLAWKVGGREDFLETFLAYIIPAFSQVTAGGYRPISGILMSLSILEIDSMYPNWGHLIFVGCLVGGLAVAFKSVASRFIKSKLIVYVCLILFMFSSPVAQSNWILYSGIPVLIPFFTCIGLMVYFEICEQPKERGSKLWLLALIVIFGTWYREFMIALPLLILGMEIIRARRITKVALLAGVLILFCLFPTFVPYLIFKISAFISGYGLDDIEKGALRNGLLLPLKPIFQLGNVDHQLSGALTIRGEVSRHLLSMPSPSLLIMAFSGFVSLALMKTYRQINTGKLNFEGVTSASASVIGLVSLAGIASSSAGAFWPYHLGILAFILIAWTIDSRLAIWTVVFLAPFYLVYTERVHLAYVMMPVVIVVAALLERCWIAQQFGATLRVLQRFVASIAMIIGVLDASANPIAVQNVMSRISDGIEIVGQEFTEVPLDRPVAIIGNALHVDELRLYLDGGYQILWTVGAGHDRPWDTIETPEQLSRFLKAKLPMGDVYFLDIRQDYLPGKKYYHQHRFVAGCSVRTDDVGLLHVTRVEYFMPDPLRWFGSREFFAFLGPPDLVNDFYYGPSSRPFYGKVEAEYHLYKVTSEEVESWIPLGQVSLIDGNFLGFSIVSQNGRFFAIPVGEGDFSYKRVCHKSYSKSFEASSFDEIKEMVKGFTAR